MKINQAAVYKKPSSNKTCRLVKSKIEKGMSCKY